ncbi:transcriptional regulator LysR [Acidocella aminolytica 101 = DSM 11237]|uniref:Transcriptional regulator LysR n=2 Tax=Acidocella TaxID=50709 RepID=A0A0D6PCV6_9PROT|nr:LysR family transcriptional regulator [Acidocella aminolytica]GAN79502.1 transcriptional regulator LysR [Acidocella aminolytica 101 = DSM 11237]GBQ44319.1 transcriptional regulator [Acidocella aminolytica 101 = DSM 11237]
MMDRVIAAKVFVETVERASTTAAADALGMSRAMASRYLSALEDWTGTRLLHRTTRRLSLTSAGERVLDLSREMVRVANDMSAAAGEGDSPHGLLRVAAPTILVEERLAPLLARFLCLHPRLSIDLRASDRPVDLVDDRIDLAIRIGRQLDPNCIARKLGETRSTLCASPSYLAERGVPAHPDDLSSHSCLTYTNFGAAEWHLHSGSVAVKVKALGPFRTNETLALRRAVLCGVGIAMLPTFAVEGLIASNALQAVLPGWEPQPHPIHVLYLSRDHLPAAARALIKYLEEDIALHKC